MLLLPTQLYNMTNMARHANCYCYVLSLPWIDNRLHPCFPTLVLTERFAFQPVPPPPLLEGPSQLAPRAPCAQPVRPPPPLRPIPVRPVPRERCPTPWPTPACATMESGMLQRTPAASCRHRVPLVSCPPSVVVFCRDIA